MVNYVAPLKDLRFLFEDVFDFDTFWGAIGRPGDIDIDLALTILAEAAKFSEGVLAPINQNADKEACDFESGDVYSPSGFQGAYKAFSENGWNGLGSDTQYGGAGLPKTLVTAVEEMIQGSCMSFALCPISTAAAALTINTHASDELKAVYLPKMVSGQWSAAMDITEPHAGTDIGLIRTKATPKVDGTHVIKGSKIFITWGEHDMAENIVHLVLAKLPSAPEGPKGLSLFLVPKFIPDKDGNLIERNKVFCGGIEHKMGIHGSATCAMNFDEAVGWLVGDTNKGLHVMFTMMNSMRLSVGTNAVGVAEASLQSAIAYAKDRLQGRSPDGPVSPDKHADPLLVHPDVRRMLMTVKAYTEASRAFYLYVAFYMDLSKYSKDNNVKRRAEGLVTFLTPIAKAFISDVSFDSTLLSQQIFGGHGYIREWGQEQHVRDVRVTQMFEGTNGIQAMDLIQRKTLDCNGALLDLFAEDVENFVLQHQEEKLKEFSGPLSATIKTLKSATVCILSNAQAPSNTGAIATDYLKLTGFVAFAFMWAKMAAAAISNDNEQKQKKLATARFYFSYLLPKIETHATRIKQSDRFVSAMKGENFT